MVGFAGGTAQWQDGDVLVHLVGQAGDWLVALEMNQIGALLPDSEGASAKHDGRFNLVGEPALVDLRKQFEQRVARSLLGADTGVVLHEAVQTSTL